jgi:hypothetical protein
MSFRSSNSLAILGLVAGCFVPCVMPFSARAGDKIEFSTASVPLEVPRMQREAKESPNSTIGVPTRPEDAISAEEMQDSAGGVIIASPKKKTVRAGDSIFTDDRDDTTDADSRYDSLDSKRRPVNRATNMWDLGRGWNQDTGIASANHIGHNPAGQASLRDRLEALHATGRDDYQSEQRQRDERYDKGSTDSDEDSVWSRRIFHYGLSGMGGTQVGQFDPFYDETKAMNQGSSQVNSWARPPSVIDDQLRDSRMTPGMAEYNSQLDILRGKTPEATQDAPGAFRPVETRTVSQNSDPYARQQPPASPPGQVQSPPAILPFPKRPGSVFQ